MSYHLGTASTIDDNQSSKPNLLTLFTVFWACQALVHQEFYSFKWLHNDNPMGWVLTIAAILVVLFPRSIALLSFMLISSLIYNIGLMPYVVNHILLESLINITILLAIAYAYLQKKANLVSDREFRHSIFIKFSPVVSMFVIMMYWFIVNSKTNYDFFNLNHSCLSNFYIDMTDRLDFVGLPKLDVQVDNTPALVSLWIFMIVELLIPLGLMFKKTRYPAILIGVPFHMLLAIIGHRTFTGLILALYVMISAESIAVLFAKAKKILGVHLVRKIGLFSRVLIASVVLVFLVIYLTEPSLANDIFQGSNRLIFFLVAWSVVGGMLYMAILHNYIKGGSEPTQVWTMSPRYLWLMVIPVLLNGLSPFLGFKTQTSFAMYSNMRTEGSDKGNHMFMPTINLVGYQEDIVDIIDTDHPILIKWIKGVPLGDRTKTTRKLNVVYFELNRVVAETIHQQPEAEFFVTYSRNGGKVQTFRSNDPGAKDTELAELKSIILRKLMFFRPVHAGDISYCQH